MSGPKLNRDWIGLRVKLRIQATNAYGRLSAGTIGKITGYSKTGIRFTADKCPCCSVQLSISGMSRPQFEILTPLNEWPNTSKSKKQRR